MPLARRDLLAAPTQLRGRRYWTIKDPIALRYYQLRDEEHFLWGLLDGKRTLDEIVVEFERRYAPRRLRRSELSGFLMLLHREGLVLAPAWGQGPQLVARRDQRLWQQQLSQLTNLLAIQLPGINPDRLLSAIVPRLSWIFSARFLTAVVALLTAAGVLVAVKFGTLAERLPHFRDFFSAANLLWLAVTLLYAAKDPEVNHARVLLEFLQQTGS